MDLDLIPLKGEEMNNDGLYQQSIFLCLLTFGKGVLKRLNSRGVPNV